jgi:hypothetical protein
MSACLGAQFFLAASAIVSAATWVYRLRRSVCTRWINFSCLMNAAPKAPVNTYRRQNPDIRQAWEQSGYKGC